MEERMPQILVVDDTKPNIEVLEGALAQENYSVHVALSGKRALELVKRSVPDLILLDVMMPEMDGYETFRRLREIPGCQNVPVIFLTAQAESESEMKGLSLGADDYIAKPFNQGLLKLRIRNQLERKFYRDHLSDLVAERTNELSQKTKDLQKTLQVMLTSLGALAEFRDNETGTHLRRTQAIVRKLAHAMSQMDKFKKELPNEEIVEEYAVAAPLHDIGKVGITDGILRKPGTLTAEEREQMKKHTILGYQVLLSATQELNNNPMVIIAANIAKYHHEKWDGTGYPSGLSGTDIPLCARIMAVADVYDALVSKRVYKDAIPHLESIRIIREGAGKHFDPDVVKAFETFADELPEIYKGFGD
jgi:putative two-component system response regulator